MTDIVQLDHGQLNKTNSYAAGVTPQHVDARLLLLPLLSLLSFATAFFIALYALLRRFLPQLYLPVPTLFEAINWPAGLTTFRFLAILFFLIAIALYLVARWQIQHNRSVQASAGCPSCQEKELMRISRSHRDRLFTLSGVRVARYQCRECLWNGRRVFIKTYHPLDQAPPQGFLNFTAVAQPDLYKIPAKTAVVEAPPATGPSAEAGEADAQDVRIAESHMAVTESKDEATPPVGTLTDNQQVVTERANGSVKIDQEQLLNPGDRARIMTTFGVNLRAQPQSDANWVGLLGPDTLVTINRSQRQDDGTAWYHIIAYGHSGWVTEACLEGMVPVSGQ